MVLIENGILGEFPYAIHENEHAGHLFGYLGVPHSHPWYGKQDGIECDVHGGITFAEASFYGSREKLDYLLAEIAKAEAFPDDLETEVRGVPFKIPSLKPFGDFYRQKLNREIEKDGDWNSYPVEIHLDLWWVGFDCGHYGDAHKVGSPMWIYDQEFEKSHPQYAGMDRGTYRDRDYVYNELESLAAQAAEAVRSSNGNESTTNRDSLGSSYPDLPSSGV